jgi:tripartite-type tricarboxylate transporter receptor subunit TctC
MVANMRGPFVTESVLTPSRRVVLQGLTGTALATLPTAGWGEAEYPSRTITVICPFAPGGINDVCARVVAKGLEAAFKLTVITENRPGASTLVAMDHLARSAPDGYILLTCSDRIVCFPTIGKTPFDIEKDFAPITRLIISPMFLVTRPGLEVKSVTDLIALAKAKPTLTFASTGPGSTTHLTGELFKARTGVNMVHVPFRGSGPALTDVMGGHIDVMFADLGSATPFIRSGKLHAVAVANPHRSHTFPDVPTFAESGLSGFEASLWIGLLARGGTSSQVIERLNHEVVVLLKNPENASLLTNLGTEIATNTPEEFAELIAQQRARVAPILKAENIRIDQ